MSDSESDDCYDESASGSDVEEEAYGTTEDLSLTTLQEKASQIGNDAPTCPASAAAGAEGAKGGATEEAVDVPSKAPAVESAAPAERDDSSPPSGEKRSEASPSAAGDDGGAGEGTGEEKGDVDAADAEVHAIAEQNERTTADGSGRADTPSQEDMSERAVTPGAISDDGSGRSTPNADDDSSQSQELRSEATDDTFLGDDLDGDLSEGRASSVGDTRSKSFSQDTVSDDGLTPPRDRSVTQGATPSPSSSSRRKRRGSNTSLRQIAELQLQGELKDEEEVDVSSASTDPLAFAILPRCTLGSAGRAIEEKKMKMFERTSRQMNKDLEQHKAEKQAALIEKENSIRTIEDNMKKDLGKQSQGVQNSLLVDQRAMMEKHALAKKALEAQIASQRQSEFAALKASEEKQIVAKKKELRETKKAWLQQDMDKAKVEEEMQALESKEMLLLLQQQAQDRLRLRQQHEGLELDKRNKLAARQSEEQFRKQFELMIKQLTVKLDALSQRQWLRQESHREKYTLLQVWQNNEFSMKRKMQSDIHTAEAALLKEQHNLEWVDLEKKIAARSKTEESHLKKALKKQKKQLAKEIKGNKSLRESQGRSAEEESRSKFAANQEALRNHEIMALARKHHAEKRTLKAEHKLRKSLLMEQSQTANNALQEQITKETAEREQEMQREKKKFEEEQVAVRESFAAQQADLLLALQEQHFKQQDEIQEQHVKERQELSEQLKDQLAKNPYFAAEERARREAEEARRLAEEEAEKKRIAESERRAAEEKLKREMEEKKQEVMRTEIREKSPEDIKMEYIRKIANETGLSEDIIAKNMDRMGMGFRYL